MGLTKKDKAKLLHAFRHTKFYAKGIYKFKLLSQGTFRDIYTVNDLPVIIKLPHKYKAQPGDVPEHDDPVKHSGKEIDLIRRIQKEDSLIHLRPYLPIIYYASHTTGIIIMKKYIKKRRKRFSLQERVIVRMFRDALHKGEADYGRKNLLRDENDEPVIVDLGY